MDNRSRRAAALIVVVAWIVLLVVLLSLGWLLTHPWASAVDARDNDVERWLADHRTSGLDRAASIGTFLGNTLFGLVLAAVVAIAVSVWQHSRRPAIFVTTLVVGAFALYLAATQLISRDRPPVRILDPGLVPDHSFPSGHVITAVVVYGGAAVLIARAVPRTRRWLALVLVVPLAVALARLYQGAHHPTDVLTSLVLATAWLAVVTRAVLAVPSSEVGVE